MNHAYRSTLLSALCGALVFSALLASTAGAQLAATPSPPPPKIIVTLALLKDAGPTWLPGSFHAGPLSEAGGGASVLFVPSGSGPAGSPLGGLFAEGATSGSAGGTVRFWTQQGTSGSGGSGGAGGTSAGSYFGRSGAAGGASGAPGEQGTGRGGGGAGLGAGEGASWGPDGLLAEGASGARSSEGLGGLGPSSNFGLPPNDAWGTLLGGPAASLWTLGGQPIAEPTTVTITADGTTTEQEITWAEDQPRYFLESQGGDTYRRVQVAEKEGYVVSLTPVSKDGTLAVSFKLTRRALTGGDYDASIGAYVGQPSVDTSTCAMEAPVLGGLTTVVTWRAMAPAVAASQEPPAASPPALRVTFSLGADGEAAQGGTVPAPGSPSDGPVQRPGRGAPGPRASIALCCYELQADGIERQAIDTAPDAADKLRELAEAGTVSPTCEARLRGGLLGTGQPLTLGLTLPGTVGRKVTATAGLDAESAPYITWDDGSGNSAYGSRIHLENGKPLRFRMGPLTRGELGLPALPVDAPSTVLYVLLTAELAQREAAASVYGDFAVTSGPGVPNRRPTTDQRSWGGTRGGGGW